MRSRQPVGDGRAVTNMYEVASLLKSFRLEWTTESKSAV